MNKTRKRRTILRWVALGAAAAALSACHIHNHGWGQIRRHQTPAATGTAPGKKKKKP